MFSFHKFWKFGKFSLKKVVELKDFTVKFNLINSNLSSHINILFLVLCSREKTCHKNVLYVCLSVPHSVSKRYKYLVRQIRYKFEIYKFLMCNYSSQYQK